METSSVMWLADISRFYSIVEESIHVLGECNSAAGCPTLILGVKQLCSSRRKGSRIALKKGDWS